MKLFGLPLWIHFGPKFPVPLPNIKFITVFPLPSPIVNRFYVNAMELSLFSSLHSNAPSSILSSRNSSPRLFLRNLSLVCSSSASSFLGSNFPALVYRKNNKRSIHCQNRPIMRIQSSMEINNDGDDGFVVEGVPHLTDFLSDLPVSFCSYNFIAYF